MQPYHSVLLVLDGGDEFSELLERPGDDELVVRLPRPDALELEVHQPLREAPLRLGQRCKVEGWMCNNTAYVSMYINHVSW